MDILLGGVPFGRNNVGDEAILECVVGIFREICPQGRITVSTDNPAETEARLGVQTVPLFGFKPPFSQQQMEDCITKADVFVWAGATGLSDYPEIPLGMLEIAHRVGTKTVVWGVGMNDKLNPYIYSILPGKRRALLSMLSWLTLKRIDFVARREKEAEDRARAKIAAELNRCDLVVLRDPETLAAVHACGDVPRAIVGADSAELLTPADWNGITLTREARQVLESNARKIGLCISAQRQLVHEKELIDFLDRLADRDYRIIFLPMNHSTDAPLMENLRERMRNHRHSAVVGGRRTPREILAIAGKLDLVISSRLHLLILASVLHVPIIGISRGSKVDNFLMPFGHTSAGSVDECNFDHMQSELDRLIDSREEFEEVSTAVHEMLLQRLDEAKQKLAGLLASC
ncbi:polysaccharide pyruvyl transferase family protein [Pontiella desulfatans]|uniref:polysaccharide pyruvyl transferase family protein n=1 Tax=Pontiella desulfatans TaxID=2750659 RepID=UPI001443DF74|nr:polysaccharide pyruvyl transferase family protein [Pontiella desulfatans]